MFEIGWSELLVIAVVAIIVIGPKELPGLMRTLGRYTGKLRRAAAEFQRQFEEAARETEIDEVRKAMQELRAQTPPLDLGGPLDKPLMTRKQDAGPPSPSAPPPSLPAASAPAPSAKPVATKSGRATSAQVKSQTKSLQTKSVQTRAVQTKSAKSAKRGRANAPKGRKP